MTNASLTTTRERIGIRRVLGSWRRPLPVEDSGWQLITIPTFICVGMFVFVLFA